MTCRPTVLSFCTIVKNEAHNLARCLASVKPYVDEMIIVDTGSTDNTVAIAQHHGAKVSHFQWCDDFSAARNYALSLASGDWILTLDADEELVVQSQEMLSNALKDGFAYLLTRREQGINDTGLQTIRLFKHRPDLTYRDPYHELLFYNNQPLANCNALVKPLTGLEIIHYGYTDEALVEKSLSRIPMLEKLRATDGLSLMLLWTLSGMYRATNTLESVQSCYEEAWERLFPHLITGECPTDTRSVRSWLYSLAVRSLQADDGDTSLFICEQGTAWFPDFPPLFYLKGLILKMTDAISDAIPYFEHCLAVGQTANYSAAEPFDQALITVYPAFDLGTAYLALDQPEKAIAAFELALSFDPNHVEAQSKLSEAKERLAGEEIARPAN